jgi:hypothetical protein
VKQNWFAWAIVPLVFVIVGWLAKDNGEKERVAQDRFDHVAEIALDRKAAEVDQNSPHILGCLLFWE